MRFIFMATDYFNKWIGAKPFLKTEAVDAIRFVKRNILYGLGVPKVMMVDNEPQFHSQAFRELCIEYST